MVRLASSSSEGNAIQSFVEFADGYRVVTSRNYVRRVRHAPIPRATGKWDRAVPASPYPTTNDLLVMHTLRCIGFAGSPRVATASGLSESAVERELNALRSAGLATHLPGDFGGWGLADAGRAADARRITDELDEAGTRAEVTAAYEGFLELNPELLEICTAWQTRSVDGVVTMNEHVDRGYDARVLRRLSE